MNVWYFEFESVSNEARPCSLAITFPRVDWSRLRPPVWRTNFVLYFCILSVRLMWIEKSAWVEVRTLPCILVTCVTWHTLPFSNSRPNQHPYKKDMVWLPIHVQISTPTKRTWFGCRFTSKSAPLKNGHGLTYFNLFVFIKLHPLKSCHNWHPYIFVMIWLQSIPLLSDSFLFFLLINLCFIDDKDQQIIL